MAELLNFPIKNQRTDGDPNAERDCIPTSLAMGLQYLLGLFVNDAAMKDAVYGRNYVGVTDPASYVPYCTKRAGVRLYPLGGSNAGLVSGAHKHLALGHPVCFTIGTSTPGLTHFCVWFADGTGWLRAADPYGGHIVTRTDADWQSLLVYGKIWIMEKIMSNPAVVPAGWTDNGATLMAPNNVALTGAYRAFVLDPNNHWNTNNWPLALMASQMIFRKTVLSQAKDGTVSAVYAGAALLAELAAAPAQVQSLSIDKEVQGDVLATIAFISDAATHLLSEISKLGISVPAPVPAPPVSPPVAPAPAVVPPSPAST